ncbi:hypothetical protein AMATHDRAFT_77717 [Amanita thiersii Skay4041]|uniref:14-3-3 domain-containing protein n=1 Tax=Amanita thiersii Skay4041 TaxID=703135 RepID=A0A2A9N8V2_9AGAR|nr:hypothetical protein AMATHDRAFT_77717 [Amanita thiersii Skay4041]
MAPARSRLTRKECLLLADVANEAERHQDVVKYIKLIIDSHGAQLTIDERNLLSMAYKNITNILRNSWRTIDNMEKLQVVRVIGAQKPDHPLASRHLALIREQRRRIERELTDSCKDIVALLDRQLQPAARSGEESVFYSKMKGDYYRYMAEFASDHDRERYGDQSLTAYKLAYKHALTTLDPIHPTRLGLALNFSVFYHDVKSSPERACHLAKSAFDDAVTSLPTHETGVDQVIRDSLTILQLLKEDLILWSREIQD